MNYPQLIGLLLASSLSAQDIADWENPAVIAREKEPPRASSIPFATAVQAKEGNQRSSPYARNLNGTWKFHWSANPEGRPKNFHDIDFNAGAWKDIPVPSSWQMQGYDTPLFPGPGYAFVDAPPKVTVAPPQDWSTSANRNPVGCYRRDFEVPTDWDGRRIMLAFDGVDSAFNVWVNGTHIGYSEDSRTAAEFDITDHVVAGTGNVLAVEVFRYSDGSYLEAQNTWRMSGIYRNVTLWSAPRVHVRDFHVTTDLDESLRDAEVTVQAKIRNLGKSAASGKLAVTMSDLIGKPMTMVGTTTLAYNDLRAGGEIPVAIKFKVSMPAKWSAENPALYTMVLEHGNSLSPAPEFRSCRFGFREISIKDGQLRVNGQPIKLKGVNRPELEPATGNTVTEEMMLADIRLLKQANCNHVRTAGYPADPRWLELCDEYGIYVTAVANIDAPGDGKKNNPLADDPAWLDAHLARVMAMVEQDMNHPSVLIWELGNRSSGGKNFLTAAAAIKDRDSSRPTCFAGFGTGEANPCDLDALVYPTPETLQKAAAATTGKPTYISEITGSLGNSLGGFAEIWATIRQSPSLAGGAVTGWQDQAIFNNRDTKAPVLSYAGDFGDRPNAGTACLNGIVDAQRRPKPQYLALKHVFQNVTVTRDGEDRYFITNHHAFTNLTEYEFHLKVLEDGKEIWSGKAISPDCAPGKTVPFAAAPPVLPLTVPGAEHILYISMRLRQATTWADAGHELAYAQFPQRGEPAKATPAEATPVGTPPKFEDSRDAITVKGKDFTVVWAKATARIKSWQVGGAELIQDGNGPSLWVARAPYVPNDSWASGDWDKNRLDKLANVSAKLTGKQGADGNVLISAEISAEGTKGGLSFDQSVTYTVITDGTILVDHAIRPKGPYIALARIGVRMFVPSSLSKVGYYGRGPMENHSDRKNGSPIAYYSSPIKDLFTPYLRPMGCGNHEDTRWLAVQAADGSGFMAIANDNPFCFSALPYTDAQLAEATHLDKLPQNPFHVVFLGTGSLAVGSTGSPDSPETVNPPKVRVVSSPARLSYTLRPLAAGTKDDALSTVARKPLPPRMPPVAISRDAAGLVTITSEVAEASILYSVNGETPKPYTAAFSLPNGGNVRGLARMAGMLETGPVSVDFPALPKRVLWTIAEFSTQEGTFESSQAVKIIDGDPATHWHSRYSTAPVAGYPHFVTVKLDADTQIAGVSLTQRSTPGNGRVKGVTVQVSTDGVTWPEGFATTMQDNNKPQRLKFPKAMTGRFVRITCTSSHNGGPWAALAEFNIIEGNP